MSPHAERAEAEQAHGHHRVAERGQRGERGEHPGQDEHHRDAQTGAHHSGQAQHGHAEVAEHLVEQRPQRAVPHARPRHVGEGVADAVRADVDGEVVDHVAALVAERQGFTGQAYAERSEHEGGDQQAHEERRIDTEKPCPQVRAQPRPPRPAADDEKAGEHEEPVDPQVLQELLQRPRLDGGPGQAERVVHDHAARHDQAQHVQSVAPDVEAGLQVGAGARPGPARLGPRGGRALTFAASGSARARHGHSRFGHGVTRDLGPGLGGRGHRGVGSGVHGGDEWARRGGAPRHAVGAERLGERWVYQWRGVHAVQAVSVDETLCHRLRPTAPPVASA